MPARYIGYHYLSLSKTTNIYVNDSHTYVNDKEYGNMTRQLMERLTCSELPFILFLPLHTPMG